MRPTWNTRAAFGIPIPGPRIRIVHAPFTPCGELVEIARVTWNRRMERKLSRYSSPHYSLTVVPHDETSFNALYRDGVPMLSPTTSFMLRETRWRGASATLHVTDVPYPYLYAARKHPFARQMIGPLLDGAGPLEVRTYATTIDDKILLSRPDGMRAYAGLLSGQGRFLDTDDIEDLQRRTTSSNLRVLAHEYSRECAFIGIINDNDQLGGRATLVGTLPVALRSDDVKERVLALEPQQRDPSSREVVCAPGTQDALENYCASHSFRNAHCPATAGFLSLYRKVLAQQAPSHTRPA
ncbi:MAG: hypothetical protein AABY13_03725 [Nanoarchaeota archaeon]